ncbi:hypothetical protein [Methanohalobium evestigatum]|uniref:hypothetical protein n=1 Tax=Methanohalobium evestigatum TaxID=2322 RepID=UPI000677FA91|nr:hypothetical protein [Methanohalobium evestigatum]
MVNKNETGKIYYIGMYENGTMFGTLMEEVVKERGTYKKEVKITYSWSLKSVQNKCCQVLIQGYSG